MVVRPRRIPQPKIDPALADRLPPGQFPARRLPVLHCGTVPEFDPAAWNLCVDGLVDQPLLFTWETFQTLPTVAITADMHCVTRWSKLDNTWEGVPFREIIRRTMPSPAARFVLVHCDGDYMEDLPLAAVDDDDVLLATRQNGEPLTPEHGFPLRLVVPKRYAWKSAKWLRGVEFVAEDRPGFWEHYGYHMNADPWREERFAEQP